MESHQGYPGHFWIALGHLAEASDELVGTYPGIANRIRFERKRLEGDRAYKPDLMAIIDQLEHPDLNDKQTVDALDAHRQPVAEPAPGPPAKEHHWDPGPFNRAGLYTQDEPLKLLIPTMAPATVPCTPCEAEKRRQAYGQLAAQDNMSPDGYRGRLVILTTLNDFAPSYSLATCALEQARAAASLGYRVHIWARASVQQPSIIGIALPAGVTVDPIIPNVPFADDIINADGSLLLLQTLNGYIGALLAATIGHLTIINHDGLFQRAFVTLAIAIHRTSDFGNRVRWWHMAHSSIAASGPARDVSNRPLQARTTLPIGRHRLLAVTYADVQALARYYDTSPDKVDVLRNSRDPRSFLGMSDNAALITTQAGLLQADVVQIMPLCATRFVPKGAFELVRLFASMHQQDPDQTYRLVFACANANGDEIAQAVGALKQKARELYLPDDALVFTHEILPDTGALGLPQADIRALFAVSNLFAFPTTSEASSLTVLEAAVSGCLLVLNENLPCMRDCVQAQHALWVLWDTIRQQGAWSPTMVGINILDALGQPCYQGKRHALRMASRDRYAAELGALLDAPSG